MYIVYPDAEDIPQQSFHSYDEAIAFAVSTADGFTIECI